MTVRRTAARTLAVPTAAAAVLLAAGPASAHVTISPPSGAAGAYTVLTVSVPHGCDGSATTKVAIQIPEQIVSVTPTRNPLWTVTKKSKKLADPVTDAHGNTVTKRDAVVVYTAKDPLPDGYRDAFELSLQVPDAAGTTLAFPTVQTCVKGETAWTEVAPDGQDAESLEHPAPTLTVTPAEGDGADAAASTTATQGAADVADVEDSASDDGGDALGIAGLVAGLLGLLAGGLALARSRRA